MIKKYVVKCDSFVLFLLFLHNATSWYNGATKRGGAKEAEAPSP